MAFVLIVDDHTDTCHVMARLMRRLGRESRCVYRGADALELIASDTPAHGPPRLGRTDPPQRLQAVHLRHRDVEQDHADTGRAAEGLIRNTLFVFDVLSTPERAPWPLASAPGGPGRPLPRPRQSCTSAAPTQR